MSSDDLGDGYGYQERRGKGWKQREQERDDMSQPEPIGTSHTKLVAFLRHLVEDEGFNADDLLHVLDKPWKWQAEYDQWQSTVKQ